MAITAEEFAIVINATDHVLKVWKIQESHSQHTMTRVFDPGSGLRCLLKDITSSTERRDILVTKPIYTGRIATEGEEKLAMEYFREHILPKSIYAIIEEFIVSNKPSDDSDSALLETKIMTEFSKILKHLCSDVLLNFQRYYKPKKDESCDSMARYFTMTIMICTVSSNKDIHASVKSLINQCCSVFFRSEREADEVSVGDYAGTKVAQHSAGLLYMKKFLQCDRGGHLDEQVASRPILATQSTAVVAAQLITGKAGGGRGRFTARSTTIPLN